MARLKDICGPVTEAKIQEYRYNVVLKTKVGGFKLYLETNITAVSKRDAVQTVRQLMDKARRQIDDVLMQKWAIQTVTQIKPTSKMEHQQRMMRKK
jgi:hypothetical protein